MISWILLGLCAVVSAFLEIPDDNLALSDSIKFDASNHVWTLSFLHTVPYTFIIPQICHASSFAGCAQASHQSILDCTSLHDMLLGANWITNDNIRFDGQQCPLLSDDIQDNGVGHLVYISHPPAVRIKHNITALDLYSGSYVNNSYSLRVRVVFVKVHDANLFQVSHVQKVLSLEPTDIPGSAFSVQHECRSRGLVAPPKSTLTTVMDNAGSYVCMWQCDMSHVRFPFNSPPPLAGGFNTSNRVCVPLPDAFTAVKFNFGIYMQVSVTGVPVLGQEFYDGLNELSQLIQDEAENVFGACMVILTVEGDIYGKNTIDDILLAHTVNRGLFSDYETIRIAPSRRLLTSAVIHGVVWFGIEGVIIISRANLHNIVDLHDKVDSVTASVLQGYTFDPALKVDGMDRRVSIRSLHRSVAGVGLPGAAVETAMQTHDVVFYIVLCACVVIIVAKTLMLRLRSRRRVR